MVKDGDNDIGTVVRDGDYTAPFLQCGCWRTASSGYYHPFPALALVAGATTIQNGGHLLLLCLGVG